MKHIFEIGKIYKPQMKLPKYQLSSNHGSLFVVFENMEYSTNGTFVNVKPVIFLQEEKTSYSTTFWKVLYNKRVVYIRETEHSMEPYED